MILFLFGFQPFLLILNVFQLFFLEIRKKRLNTFETRQVYNLFQEPEEQPPLGFSIAEANGDYYISSHYRYV